MRPDSPNFGQNSERKHEVKDFETAINGFTSAKKLGMKPANVSEYQASQTEKVPQPGEFCVDSDGTIAAAMLSGDMVVWIPKSNPAEPREVVQEKAIQNLKDRHYTLGNFSAPKY